MTPQEKRKQTLIAKHGSYEAYIEHMKAIGSKGGKTTGESKNRGSEFMREIGKKGATKRWQK